MALRAGEVVASVRATLDYPPPDKLKMQTLLLKLREKVDHYFTRLNLTDRNWFLNQEILTVTNGQDEYIIASADWGRPINCETQDLTDPQHIRREIEIVDLQDRDLLYGGPNQPFSGASGPWKHSAKSLAFYRRDGVVTVKITPVPSDTAEYVLWFESNRPLPTALSGNLQFLDQFNNLLVTDVAISCIPYCQYDPRFGQSLAGALERDFRLYLETFEEYIQNDVQQQISVKAYWGDQQSMGSGDDWW